MKLGRSTLCSCIVLWRKTIPGLFFFFASRTLSEWFNDLAAPVIVEYPFFFENFCLYKSLNVIQLGEKFVLHQ